MRCMTRMATATTIMTHRPKRMRAMMRIRMAAITAMIMAMRSKAMPAIIRMKARPRC